MRLSVAAPIVLVKEQILRGRFVDLQGQPAAGVHARVVSVRRPGRDDRLSNWVAAYLTIKRFRLPGRLRSPPTGTGVLPLQAFVPDRWLSSTSRRITVSSRNKWLSLEAGLKEARIQTIATRNKLNTPMPWLGPFVTRAVTVKPSCP